MIPGYVWARTQERFVPRRQIQWSERLLEFLVFSLVNYALWSTIWLSGIIEMLSTANIGVIGLAQVVVTLLISPMLLGACTGIAASKDWLGAVLAKTRIRSTIDPSYEYAWDKAFSRDEQCIVSITLKDGSKVNGLLGRGSCASLSPNCRDIFLQDVYAASQESGSEHKSIAGNRGVWIAADQIGLAFFFDYGVKRCSQTKSDA